MEITKEKLELAASMANHKQLLVMYEAMKKERDALAAQLRMIRKIFRDESLSVSETLRKIPFVIDLTPEQCLAEIRAAAGRDGFIAGFNTCFNYEGMMDLSELSNNYAQQIKNGW